MGTNDISDGCPECHGKGDVLILVGYDMEHVRKPCPECERVRGLLKAERERWTVWRICEHCNQEYKLLMVRSGNATEDTIVNMTNCSNCGERDDPWIMLKRDA